MYKIDLPYCKVIQTKIFSQLDNLYATNNSLFFYFSFIIFSQVYSGEDILTCVKDRNKMKTDLLTIPLFPLYSQR